MDWMGRAMMMVAAGGMAAVIVRTIADAVIRYAQLQKQPDAVNEQGIHERLARIEVAVDAIAIEVERLGEHHRFNAQLALNRPEPLPPRVVTPH